MELCLIRENEIREIQNKIDNCDVSSSCISVFGNSGTGKTFMVQQALEKYFDEDINIIYINLVDDILSTTAFWDIFLFSAWNGGFSDKDNMLKITKKDSISRFLKYGGKGKKYIKSIFQTLSSVVATIPVYKAQLEIAGYKAINEPSAENKDIDKSQLLLKYFKHITKKKKLLIIIDNYQFMNSIIRRYFETMLGQINKNLIFINIQQNNSKLYTSPLLFQSNQKKIELLNLDKTTMADCVLHPIYKD